MNYPPALSPRDSAATRPFSDGVPAGTVHELRAPETTAGHLAWAARLLAPGTGPVLWASHAAYPPGIAWAGLDPARCLFAEARDDAEALATLELALRGGMAGVAESATCPRLAARRLALAARQGGSVGFLLRHATGGRLLAELLYAQGAQPASFLMDMETEHGPTPPAVTMAPERRRAG
jgi:protein ImuA